jgi:polar amino acid transport system substrate-binding protein
LKKLTFVFIAIALCFLAEANEPLELSNDAWPPFIVDGAEQGTAERLVCQALERSGWPCSVRVDDWESVLENAKAGEIDGIAAAWRNPDRESYLLFSEPYLTNRIVPVVNNTSPDVINSIPDLAGKRVALVKDYAYGDEIQATALDFEVIQATSSMDAIKAVADGKADVALVDELLARDALGDPHLAGLGLSDAVLAFRSLHLAISRQHPQAEQVIADFHRAYQLMLADGTVNEILDVNWLATDFGHSGRVDLVLRSGVSLDELSHPSDDGSVYALENSEYQIMRKPDLDPSRVSYQVEGKSYSSLQSALNTVFGKNTACQHKEFSSEFDCTNLFKKR